MIEQLECTRSIQRLEERSGEDTRTRTLVGDEEVELAVPLVDGAEVVVPEEHSQLALAQRRLFQVTQVQDYK